MLMVCVKFTLTNVVCQMVLRLLDKIFSYITIVWCCGSKGIFRAIKMTEHVQVIIFAVLFLALFSSAMQLCILQLVFFL